jgi:stage V sporulation protein AD
MTTRYNKVFIKDTYTIAGTYENDGPLKEYFDKTYPKDLYLGEKTWEQAEVKLQKECIRELINNNKLTDKDINLLVAGDLQNQIAASSYSARDFDIPFLGIYNACSTSAEGLIIAADFIEGNQINNCIVSTSSHNMVAEKQFRNPTEYGSPKHKTATFTATGGAAILVSNDKTDIKIESSTIGRVIDKGVSDVNNMGAVMAPAAADTIYRHLSSLGRNPSYYDLILTGDLGLYGKNILINYLKETYNLDISKNYNDCGTMLYDLDSQPVLAGGSGPVCSALVNFGYIYKIMKEKKLKKVLIVPTGALFSPTLVFQKMSIPAIAHAIGIEVVK